MYITAVGLPRTNILCRYGKALVSKYRSFKTAEHGIEEQTVAIEATWLKISQQLAFLKRIWKTLPEDYQDLQGRILGILERKLQHAVGQLSKVEKRLDHSIGAFDKRKAAKYALLLKENLQDAVSDLQGWQKEFDPTWFLVLRTPDEAIDNELAKGPGTERLSTARHVRGALKTGSPQGRSVFLPADDLGSAIESTVPYSTSKIMEIPRVGPFIIDSADCASRNDAADFGKAVRDLALRLQKVDAREFHLLKCHGVVRTKDLNMQKLLSYDFVFHIPQGFQRPQSLRSHLLSQTAYSLTDKISLAKQLATSVNYVHVLDYVHKNIRPETALVFEGFESTQVSLFLVGFRAFRMAESKTLRLGTSIWAEEIYQHPERHGISPSVDYVMQHDIYSLGVCLLEIGLWQSFVDESGHVRIPMADDNDQESKSMEMGSLGELYISLARKKLPTRMGDQYTRIVINCLTCMDAANVDFGDPQEFEDEDGIFIGVKYIEKVRTLNISLSS